MADIRVSSYEILLSLPEETGGILAVNGLYSAFDIVTGEDAVLLQKGREDSRSLEGISEDCRKRLCKRGHLVKETPEEEQENAQILSKVYRQMNSEKMIRPVIIPGNSCNFRCKYCFERKAENGGAGFGAPAVMSEELAETVFSWLEQKKNLGYRIDGCTVYGGEPLLEQNRQVLGIIAGSCRRLGISADCVTNGYLLEKFPELLSEKAFSLLQITVDGPKEVHDLRRCTADGGGSFEKIMDNIGLALEHGIRAEVRININRENLYSAMELPEEFRRRGFSGNPGFSWYCTPTVKRYEEDVRNAVSEQELFEVLSGNFGQEEAIRRSGSYRIMADRLHRCLDGKDRPELTPNGCGAETGMIVIDPDGQLHTCWEKTGRKEDVGKADPKTGGFQYGRDYYRWRTRTADRMENCRTCPYLMFCGGGCAAAAEAENGRLFTGDCGEKKEIFNCVAVSLAAAAFSEKGEKSPGSGYYDLFSSLESEERDVLREASDGRKVAGIYKKYLR